PPDVIRRVNAAFAHQQAVGRYLLAQVDAGVQRRVEGIQIPVVDADDGVLRQAQHPLQLGCVVDFGQHVHAQVEGGLGQVVQGVVIECGGNQQNAVGAQSAGFRDLDRVDDEVLAQHRQGAGRTRLGQVVGIALEELAVGQYGQAGGAAGGIARG